MSLVPTSSSLETPPVNLLAKRLEAEKEKKAKTRTRVHIQSRKKIRMPIPIKDTLETDLLLRQKQYEEQCTLHREQWTTPYLIKTIPKRNQ